MDSSRRSKIHVNYRFIIFTRSKAVLPRRNVARISITRLEKPSVYCKYYVIVCIYFFQIKSPVKWEFYLNLIRPGYCHGFMLFELFDLKEDEKDILIAVFSKIF